MRRCVLTAAVIVMAAFAASGTDYLNTLPSVSSVMPGYSVADSVMERMERMPLCPVEGLWQMVDDGALFAIERVEGTSDVAPERMRIVMVSSPMRRVRPGTVVGLVRPTAKSGTYQARMYTRFAEKTGLKLSRPFTMRLSDDMLVIEPFKYPVKINLFRLLPYMYRRVVTPQASKPEGLKGAFRVYPASAGHPLSPIYL